MKSDVIRVRHMLDAAMEAASLASGKAREDLDTDRMLTLSLVQLVAIVGEAASTASEEYRKAHATIPWARIVAMRNRLVHAYWDINLDRLWSTVQENLPPLIAELENILATEDPGRAP